MDTQKANKILVPYMMHLLEKITYKKFKYNMDMASDALKHSNYMAENKKTTKTPDSLLYCHENIGTITVPSKYAKLGIFNIVNNWFRYEQSKQKLINSDEIGIGISTVQDNNNLTIFVTQRSR